MKVTMISILDGSLGKGKLTSEINSLERYQMRQLVMMKIFFLSNVDIYNLKIFEEFWMKYTS